MTTTKQNKQNKQTNRQKQTKNKQRHRVRSQRLVMMTEW